MDERQSMALLMVEQGNYGSGRHFRGTFTESFIIGGNMAENEELGEWNRVLTGGRIG